MRTPRSPSRDGVGRGTEGEVPQDEGPATADPPMPSLRPGQNLESMVL